LNIPTTFRLLARLVRNAGRVVAHAELLREVWDCSDGGTPAQLKNCIKRLRQKIESDPKRPRYVLTAYGHGYFMPNHAEAESTNNIAPSEN
jgi:two-component system KDP operon response regulator KdpE